MVDLFNPETASLSEQDYEAMMNVKQESGRTVGETDISSLFGEL